MIDRKAKFPQSAVLCGNCRFWVRPALPINGAFGVCANQENYAFAISGPEMPFNAALMMKSTCDMDKCSNWAVLDTDG